SAAAKNSNEVEDGDCSIRDTPCRSAPQARRSLGKAAHVAPAEAAAPVREDVRPVAERSDPLPRRLHRTAARLTDADDGPRSQLVDARKVPAAPHGRRS